jgi:DNA-nicking Smr family endonuclease
MRKKSKAQGPFAALSCLKRAATRSVIPKESLTKSARPEPTKGLSPLRHGREQGLADENDVALFRQAVRDVRPLPAPNRAAPQAPHIAPEPRFSGMEQTPEPSRSLGQWKGGCVGPEDETRQALEAAFAGVQPLKPGSHRVDLIESRKAFQKERPSLHMPTCVSEPGLALSHAAHLDDETLFRVALAFVQPLRPSGRIDTRPTPPPPEPRQFRADEDQALSQSLSEPFSLEDRLDMGEEAAFLREGLPRRILMDLRRGRWVLQGEMDLHGLNRTQAREALGGFLAHSVREGRRCVRIIHGKGLGSPGKVSILKQLTRGWLAQREEILAFCQAQPHDGGCGALLVLLKGKPHP